MAKFEVYAGVLEIQRPIRSNLTLKAVYDSYEEALQDPSYIAGQVDKEQWSLIHKEE